MRAPRRAAVAVSAAATLAVLPLAAAQAAPSQAVASRASAGTAAPCHVPASGQARVAPGATPTFRGTPLRGRVDQPVTAADLAALPAAQSRPSFVQRQVAPALPTTVTIPVYVHVIKGTHRGEGNPFGPKRVARLLSILNGGFSGAQDPNTPKAVTRYRFVLKKTDYTKRDGWYHAYLNGPRDQKAKRALHRGGAGSLNLYLNGGGPRENDVLGWSRFPWQYAANPKLDNVSVNVAATPGGSAKGYNLGDTVIHETGHWMGLFHTFQGGCSAQGDLVADTPAEAEPSFYCETDRDTCTEDDKTDPVHNFMDYSLDSCMDQFTLGQVSRMDAAFEKWRS